MPEARHLLDVNVLIALSFESHKHHRPAVGWFDSPGLQWALCPWTEAGFLRFAMRSEGLTASEAASLLEGLAQHPGYHFQPVTHNWQTLTKPFSQRIHGHNQITDACLLGLALHYKLVLATFDRAITYLAGEHGDRVYLLPGAPFIAASRTSRRSDRDREPGTLSHPK